MKALKDVMERVETWPEEAQEELALIAREMEAGIKGGVYRASREELVGIDCGLKAVAEWRLASHEAVVNVWAKYRSL